MTIRSTVTDKLVGHGKSRILWTVDSLLTSICIEFNTIAIENNFVMNKFQFSYNLLLTIVGLYRQYYKVVTLIFYLYRSFVSQTFFLVDGVFSGINNRIYVPLPRFAVQGRTRYPITLYIRNLDHFSTAASLQVFKIILFRKKILKDKISNC